MQLHLRSGMDVYLDGLCVECILSTFNARDLAVLSQVCQTMRAPAQLAAHRTLLLLVRRLQATLLRHCERGSWIAQLREWEATKQANLVWLQAEEAHTALVTQGEQTLVKRVTDLSGNGNFAAMAHRMPGFKYDAVNGHPAFEFDGASVLKTKAFAQALPQPITIMVVAKLRGDTTICDSLGPTCARPLPRPARAAALRAPSWAIRLHAFWGAHAFSNWRGPTCARRRCSVPPLLLHLQHSAPCDSFHLADSLSLATALARRRALLVLAPPFAPSPHPLLLTTSSSLLLLARSSSRFELCHGYPSGWHPSPEICMTASGQDSSPRHSLRGT